MGNSTHTGKINFHEHIKCHRALRKRRKKKTVKTVFFHLAMKKGKRLLLKPQEESNIIIMTKRVEVEAQDLGYRNQF